MAKTLIAAALALAMAGRSDAFLSKSWSPAHTLALAVPTTSTSSSTTTSLAAASAAGESAVVGETAVAGEPPQLVAPPKALLVVGAGVLGRRVAAQYDAAGKGFVTCETRSEANHAAISAELPFLKAWDRTLPDPRGLLRTKAQGQLSRDIFMKFGPQNFDHVVFCAPPSGNDDYLNEVQDALKMWNRKGRFVFTGSSSVYEDQLETAVVETSPVKADTGAHPRAAKLLAVEAAVTAAGGTVVRFAGLYTESRGAHSYFLKQGEVPSSGASLVNQIHYDDAASLVLAAIQKGSKGAVYMGCDDEPTSRRALADAAAAALGGSCTFTGGAGGAARAVEGRRMDNTWTRAELAWEPKHPTFRGFMEKLGDAIKLVEAAKL